MTVAMCAWIRMLAGCTIVIGGSPAIAQSGESSTQSPSVSPIRADAERGTLKVDEQSLTSESPQAITTDSVAEPSADRSANTAQIVAWLPSGMPTGGITLSSRYGWRIHPIHGDVRMHRGIDIPSAAGSPVAATAEGTISLAEWSGAYGLLVEIDHGADLATRYAHLSGLAVSAGQRVRKGQVLGYVGSTGSSTGPHLHYEVRMAGEAVDPTAFLSDLKEAASTVSDLGEGQGGD